MPNITIDQESYPSSSAFLLMSSDQRRKLIYELDRIAARDKIEIPYDTRFLAVAAESYLLNKSIDECFAIGISSAANNWADALDQYRIAVRLIYDRMWEGPYERDIAGFRKAHLDVLDREVAAGSSPHDTACSIWRVERRLQRTLGTESQVSTSSPPIYFSQSALPEPIRISKTKTPSRRYEPFIILNGFAYGVSSAWMVLEPEILKTYANEVGTWMKEHWPDGLDLCDNPSDHKIGFDLDRPNVILAAESFVRGMMLEEAASFIFDQRVREEEFSWL